MAFKKKLIHFMVKNLSLIVFFLVVPFFAPQRALAMNNQPVNKYPRISAVNAGEANKKPLKPGQLNVQGAYVCEDGVKIFNPLIQSDCEFLFESNFLLKDSQASNVEQAARMFSENNDFGTQNSPVHINSNNLRSASVTINSPVFPKNRHGIFLAKYMNLATAEDRLAYLFEQSNAGVPVLMGKPGLIYRSTHSQKTQDRNTDTELQLLHENHRDIVVSNNDILIQSDAFVGDSKRPSGEIKQVLEGPEAQSVVSVSPVFLSGQPYDEQDVRLFFAILKLKQENLNRYNQIQNEIVPVNRRLPAPPADQNGSSGSEP